MRYCTQCGAELRDDDRFCARCGTPVASQSQTRASGLFAATSVGPAGLLALAGVVGAIVVALLILRRAAPSPAVMAATPAPTTVALPTATATPAPTATPRPTATPAPPAYRTDNYTIAPRHFEAITVTNASVPSVLEGYFVITPSKDDIGFSVRAPSGGFVRTASRVAGRFDFRYVLSEVGPYVVEFDNSYSLLTGKVITVYWRTYGQAVAERSAAPPAGLEPATYRLEGGSSIP